MSSRAVPVPETSDVVPALRGTLRSATRHEHEATERSFRLMRASITPAEYLGILERFYGYYAPLERAVQRASEHHLAGVRLPDHTRAARLRRDLAAQGGAHAHLATSSALPALDSAAKVIGCLYVIEGAALGGQLIARHLATTLDVSPAHGGAFFHGDGDLTLARWQGFLAVLHAFGAAHPASHGACVGAALATFQTLRRWYEGAAS